MNVNDISGNENFLLNNKTHNIDDTHSLPLTGI